MIYIQIFSSFLFSGTFTFIRQILDIFFLTWAQKWLMGRVVMAMYIVESFWTFSDLERGQIAKLLRSGAVGRFDKKILFSAMKCKNGLMAGRWWKALDFLTRRFSRVKQGSPTWFMNLVGVLSVWSFGQQICNFRFFGLQVKACYFVS